MNPRPHHPTFAPRSAAPVAVADPLGLNDDPEVKQLLFWQKTLADYVEKIEAIEKPPTAAARRKHYDDKGKLTPTATERLHDLTVKRDELLAQLKQLDAQRDTRRVRIAKADVSIAFSPSDLLRFLHDTEGELLAHIYDLRNGNSTNLEARRRAAILFSNFVGRSIAPMAVGCNWRGQPGQVWFRLAAEQLRAFARGQIEDPGAIEAMTRLEMKLDLIAMKVGISAATLRQVVDEPDQIYGVLSHFYQEPERGSELTNYFQTTYAKPGQNAPAARGIGNRDNET